MTATSMFRARPQRPPVEAVQLGADNASDVCDWVHSVMHRSARRPRHDWRVTANPDGTVNLPTGAAGYTLVSLSDWVVLDRHRFVRIADEVMSAMFEPCPHGIVDGDAMIELLADLVARFDTAQTDEPGYRQSVLSKTAATVLSMLNRTKPRVSPSDGIRSVG